MDARPAHLPRSRRPTRWAGRAALSVLGLLSAIAGACGGDGPPDGSPAQPGPASGPAATGDGPAQAAGGDAAAVARGRRLVDQRGCLSCHTPDGRPGVGPTWQGLAGSTVRLAAGRQVVADRAYLLRAVGEPDAETVEGFSEGVMAAGIPGRPLSPTEVADIVSYLETL